VEERAALSERLLHDRLSIQVQKVKSEDAHLDLDVLNLDILLLSGHKLLERKDLLLHHFPSDRFAIQDEAGRVLLDPGA